VPNLIINGRNKENLESTKLEIERSGGGEVLALAGDLSNDNEREQIINRSLEAYDHVDILVTNTGGPPSGKFEDFRQEDWIKHTKSARKCCWIDQWLFTRHETTTMGTDHCDHITGGKTTGKNLVLSNSVRLLLPV
jgi:hypothetical protein